MTNRWVFLLGRVLFGGFFVMSGLNHFTQLQTMSGYAAAKGVPVATAAVLFSGVLLLIGGVSVVLGYLPRLGLAALVLFLVPVTFMMHAFWAIPDAQARMAEMGNFMKNLALCGGALALTAVPEPWPVSLGEKTRPMAWERRRTVAP